MSLPVNDHDFAGAIPQIYESHLVPLIFDPYAADLAMRLAARRPQRVLELAAGTGAVTRALAAALPASVPLVATDLNSAMLDQARARGTTRPVEWRQADAMQLPFPDAAFDAVVCQFGIMFFPDKARAHAEVRRVLRPGGVYLFNVWDQIRENEFADVISQALATLFPKNPPRFMARTPHGYFDHAVIAADLEKGGFATTPRIETVALRSRAESVRIPAVAYCQGTLLRSEIEAVDRTRLGEATDVATRALTERFGPGPVEGKIQAHVITIER